MIQTPVYPPFLNAAKWAGAERQEMELTREPDGRYTVDLDRFEAAITDRTRAFLLCNPHNPVGRVFTRAELEAMAEMCLRHDMNIISDEIHCDLIFSGYQHRPIASLSPEIEARTITVIAPSKTYNIPGLGCAVAVIPEQGAAEALPGRAPGSFGACQQPGLCRRAGRISRRATVVGRLPVLS